MNFTSKVLVFAVGKAILFLYTCWSTLKNPSHALSIMECIFSTSWGVPCAAKGDASLLCGPKQQQGWIPLFPLSCYLRCCWCCSSWRQIPSVMAFRWLVIVSCLEIVIEARAQWNTADFHFNCVMLGQSFSVLLGLCNTLLELPKGKLRFRCAATKAVLY